MMREPLRWSTGAGVLHGGLDARTVQVTHGCKPERTRKGNGLWLLQDSKAKKYPPTSAAAGTMHRTARTINVALH